MVGNIIFKKSYLVGRIERVYCRLTCMEALFPGIHYTEVYT